MERGKQFDNRCFDSRVNCSYFFHYSSGDGTSINNKLDNYLASKRDELNEKHTLAEFNLSRWKAKKVLEKFRYN